jgi:hypothetical protein
MCTKSDERRAAMVEDKKPTNRSQHKAVTEDSKQEGSPESLELQRRIREFLRTLKEYERTFESKRA